MSDSLVSVTNMPAEALPPPRRVCYEAHWHEQSVFISAPCRSAREWQWHCLASAILLERLEDACVLAETILECSLQFYVSELPGKSSGMHNESIQPEAGYFQVLLNCCSEEVEIWLPLVSHGYVAKHRELIDSCNLRWPDVSASIQVAYIALDKLDVERMQQGALILIPASWQERWLCTVDLPKLSRNIVATINPAAGTIELDYVLPAENIWPGKMPSQSIVTAYLDQAIAIDPSALLLGEQSSIDPGNTSIPVSLAQTNCHCFVDNDHFVADIAPVGAGFGLCIRKYC